MSDGDALPALFQTALEIEQEGRRFYFEAAERVRDPAVAASLAALARDEAEHGVQIRRFRQALERGKQWLVVRAEPARSAAAKRVEELVGGGSGFIGADATFLAVYERARELEMRSRDFYREQAAAVQDPHVTRFLRFLAGIEQVHLDILQALVRGTEEATRPPHDR